MMDFLVCGEMSLTLKCVLHCLPEIPSGANRQLPTAILCSVCHPLLLYSLLSLSFLLPLSLTIASRDCLPNKSLEVKSLSQNLFLRDISISVLLRLIAFQWLLCRFCPILSPKTSMLMSAKAFSVLTYSVSDVTQIHCVHLLKHSLDDLILCTSGSPFTSLLVSA